MKENDIIKSDSQFEFTYDELRRQSQYQVNEIRHLEEQAGRILRIWLTILGILPPSLYVIVAATSADNVSIPVSSPHLPKLASELSGTMSIGFITANILVELLFVFGAVFYVKGGIALFYTAPSNAISILRSNNEMPGIGTLDKDIDDLHTQSRQELIEDLYGNIKDHQPELETKKGHWNTCQNALREGSKFILFASLVTYPLLIDFSPLVALLVFITTSMFVFFYLFDNLNFEKIKSHVYIELHSDVIYWGGVASLLLFLAKSSPQKGEIIAFVSLLIFMISLLAAFLKGLSLEEDLLLQLFRRSSIIGFLTFFIGVLIDTSLPPSRPSGPSLVSFMFLGIMFSSALHIASIVSAIVVKKTIERTNALWNDQIKPLWTKYEHLPNALLEYLN